MELNENIAGLGKNHNQKAREHDIAKKQSQAKPAAENLDMVPYSVGIHQAAKNYAKEEHKKAEDWENHSDT